jgi:hypothetical protein
VNGVASRKAGEFATTQTRKNNNFSVKDFGSSTETETTDQEWEDDALG